MRVVLAMSFALAVGACRRGPPEVDCGAAGRAWVELVHKELEAEDPARRAEANAIVPALREELVKRCKDDAWSPAIRRCVADARSPAELERCQPPAASAPPTVEVAPPPSGGTVAP
jgi:hypothetical protein